MPKRGDDSSQGANGHDTAANGSHTYQGPRNGERRDTNRLDGSSTSETINGINNNRENRRNRGSTDSRSNINLGPWTKATNEVLELVTNTEMAFRNLGDLYMKHSKDLQGFDSIQEKFSELEQECKAKDEKIREQKAGIKVLNDLNRERSEDLEQEREDFASEREAFEEEKKVFKRMKESAEKRAKLEAAEQKVKGDKELEKLKLDQSKHFKQEMEKLEKQKKTLKDESQKEISDLEASKTKLETDKSRLLKELKDQEQELLKSQGEYNDMFKLRKYFEKETEELKVQLKTMENEFGLGSQGVDF